MDYISKSSKVYVVELTIAGTWYSILTEEQAKGCRGIKVKSRYTYGQSSQQPFDYAFNSSPASGVATTGNGFISNAGSGFGDTISPSSGMWARGAVAGTLLEIQVYE